MITLNIPHTYRRRLPALLACLIAAMAFGTVSARVVYQIMPTLTISEEYSDNYLDSATDEQEEFITSYALGFSMGIMDINKQVFLSYSPTYRDHKNLNDRDRVDHIVSVDGAFRPSKYTELEASIYYSGNSDDFDGVQRENRALLSGTTQIKKHTVLTYSHTYSDRFDEQLRTGDFRNHTINTTRVGLSHQYGKKDTLDLDVTYESDIYDTSDDDEYEKIEPDATIRHWLSPRDGIEANLGFMKKDFDDAANDIETYSGHLRYIRNVSKTLDWFAKYRHSFSETQEYTHHVFHPSVGIDWDITEDAGVSIGVGALFNAWSNENSDDIDPFIELDAFQRFDFSPRTSLVLTGESDYSNSNDDAASLGYNISYKAGAEFNHQLLKTLYSSVYGSYQRIDFRESAVERTDDTAILGAGLHYTPLRWLRLSLNYNFTDYRTTSTREDYTENQIYFSIGFIPERPIRSDKGISRDAFDDRVFNPTDYLSE